MQPISLFVVNEVNSITRTFQDYLEGFWPDLKAAHELYESIVQSLRERENESQEKEYAEHLPVEILQAGIKSGRYIQVRPAVLSCHCCEQTPSSG